MGSAPPHFAIIFKEINMNKKTLFDKLAGILKTEDCSGIAIISLDKQDDGDYNFQMEGDTQVVNFINSLIDDRKELTTWYNKRKGD